MDELEDNFENVQYMNALHDDPYKSITAWDAADEAEKIKCLERVAAVEPHLMELDTMCEGSLGFHLFLEFLRARTAPDNVMIIADFLIHCAAYRNKEFSAPNVIDMAKCIFAEYLSDRGNKYDPLSKLATNDAYMNGLNGLNRTGNQNNNAFEIKSGAKLRRCLGSHSRIPITDKMVLAKLKDPKKILKESVSFHDGKYVIKTHDDDLTTGECTGEGGSSSKDKDVKAGHTHVIPNLTPPDSWIEADKAACIQLLKLLNGEVNDLGMLNQIWAINEVGPSTMGEDDDDYGNNNKNNSNGHSKANSRIHSRANSSISITSSLLSRDAKINPEPPPSLFASLNISNTCPQYLRVSSIIEILILHPILFTSQLLDSAVLLYIFDELDEIVFSHLKTDYWTDFRSSPQFEEYINYITYAYRSLTEDDFSFFRVLGRGGFGLVNGCKHIQTGKLFAIKSFDRKRIKANNYETCCLNERDMLILGDSPYLVNLHYAFASENYLYLVLTIMTGGDLSYHLNSRKGGKFNDEETKFYTVRTILGLEALHSKNIVFRDLKPENILMNADGFTMLSDLGMASLVPKQGLSNTAGTRGYWAPEILMRDSKDRKCRYFLQVDWFSLGSCIYEFVFGISPFRSPQAKEFVLSKKPEIDRNDVINFATLEYNPVFNIDPNLHIDPDLQDLITRLLDKNPLTRLGAGGAKEVQDHPWFKDINWKHVQDMKPPFVPSNDINTNKQSDIGSFDGDYKTNKEPSLVQTNAEKKFADWDFVSHKHFQDEILELLQYQKKKENEENGQNSGCCTIS